MLIGGGGSPLPAFSVLERLREDDLVGFGVEQLGELLVQIRTAIRQLEILDSRVLSEFDRRQALGELGPQTTIDWLRAHTRCSAAAADKQLTVARQYQELQPTLEKVEEGALSMEAAEVIARALKDLPEAAVPLAQAELLEAAASAKCEPQQLRRLGDEIKHRDDAEGWSRSAARQHEERSLRVFELRDGMLGIEGALPGPEGHKFRLCLESLVGIPDQGDRRSQEQRQADALIELCRRQVGSGKLPRQGGRSPQLTVIVKTDGGAELEGYGPISPGTLKRLRGQDHVERRQSVDGCGVTLNFGRARRVFSEAQRQEIATRFPGCVAPGCTVPIRDCEIHHEEAWKGSGQTDVRRGVPLCRRLHHPLVTEGGYLLRRDASGLFELARAGP